MYSELTNLLPLERRRILTRDYALRLSVVALWFVTALTLAAGVLLLPTYILLRQTAAAKEMRVASIDTALTAVDEAALSTRLSVLSDDAKILSALGSVPSASALMRALLLVDRSGITITSFSYTPSAGKNAGTITIVGVATTRNALRSYQLALQAAPFAQTVNLPVSAFAQDTNIAFTITIALTP